MTLVVFADASFANNADFSTQLGYCIFLGDNTNHPNCLHYASYKCKRVVRSVLGGELHGPAEAYDHSFLVPHDFANLFVVSCPLILLTDSMSLLNLLIHTWKASPEKRLMNEITAIREDLERRDISDFGWLRSGENVADAFTKPEVYAPLGTLLETGMLS